MSISQSRMAEIEREVYMAHYQRELFYVCGTLQPDLKQDIKKINTLLSTGLSINCRDYEGKTALMAACEAGNINIAKYLLDHGADINAVNRKNETVLNIVCAATRINNQIEIIKLLLAHHADPNIVSESGDSPLINLLYDQYHNPITVVKLLLTAGADTDHASNIGTTPLMAACWNHHLEVVQLLLEKNVKLDVLNDSGDTALSRLTLYGPAYTDVITLLLKAGANYKRTDAYDRPLTHFPFMKAILEKVLQPEASPEAQSDKRRMKP